MMMTTFVTLVLLICEFVLALASNGNITVNTPLGLYEGALLTSRLGKEIYAFRGIRYAQPPIGKLRFKPPVPIGKHEAIYNATGDGPVCPQETDFPISEDCLMLNVYTKNLPTVKKLVQKPVIIYLHAGGFYSGSGRSDVEGPQYLLDQDIVLVTVNYRLATLGFLSLGESIAPGNNGLKDQVMAMKWVRNNIFAFGGNPDLITLAGYSAGGASVSCHLVSPMSKGLFHRAIMGSGSSLGNWPVPNHQYNLAQKQAIIFGCPRINNTKDIMQCLMNATAQQYASSFPEFLEFNSDPIIIWGPVIEEDFGQERFLTEHPVESVMKGNFQKMPVMTGITTVEFGYAAIDLVSQTDWLKKLNEQWFKYAPIIFIYERYTNFSKEVSRGLRQNYFGNKTIDNATLGSLANLYADGVTGFGVNRGADLISLKNEHPVYYYKFSYQGRYSHYYLPGVQENIPYGVVHHDELIYLFYISVAFPEFSSADPESKMVDRWTSIWANFATDGNPTPKDSDIYDNVIWKPYDIKRERYLDADKRFVLREDLYGKRYQTWGKYFPLVPNHQKQ